MRDEASCILAALKLSDYYADPRVDDISIWLDLVVGKSQQEEAEENDRQGEELPED
jgi:hypothetical protein